MKILYQFLNRPLTNYGCEANSSEFSGHWEKLTIEEDGSGNVFLLCHFLNGYIADTCHLSIEEAKEQAKFQFDIEKSEWEPYAFSEILN